MAEAYNLRSLPTEAYNLRSVLSAGGSLSLGTTLNLDRKPHPLLIPDVVADVMSRLEFSDLRNARMVCRAWSEEASKFVPAKVKICLCTFEDVTKFIALFEDTRHAYTRFKLGQYLNLQDPIMLRFFNKFGSKIFYLHLNWTHWIPASLRRLLFDKLPSLEELILCSQRVFENIRFLPVKLSDGSQKFLPNIKVLRVDGEFEGSSSQFVADLICSMPALRVFSGFPSKTSKFSKMGILRYEQFDNHTDLTLEDTHPDLVFSRLLIARRPSLKLPNLVNLKVAFDHTTIAQLRLENYPLKSLEVVIPGQTFLSWHPRPTVLHNYILSLSKTLIALKLNYCSGRPKILTSFDGIGRLRNLRHLSLHRVCGTLDFLNCLPQLKSLYMTQEDFIEHYDEFHIDECRPHKLQILKLYYTNWSASSVYSEVPRPAKILNVVENIVQRFPNLISLRAETLTDKALSIIYSNLPQLEELEATNGIFTSVGISGISVVNQGQVNWSSRKQPFIGYLKNLKKLRLESNKMTDYAILSSVLSLSTLEDLTLLCYKITDESLTALVGKMDLKYLKTEFCYELSRETIQSVTSAMEKRGAVAVLNSFCGTMEIEKIHDFLNENGPIHVSIPDFPVEND